LRGRPVKPPTFIIAEIGSNCFKYNNEDQNFRCALRQIELAKKAGADAVKFQLFTAQELWGPSCKGETFAILQNKFAMPRKWLPRLQAACQINKIEFLCSAFSVDGYNAVTPHVRQNKVASPEFLAEDIMKHLLSLYKPVIISLGCRPSKPFDSWRFIPRGTDTILECVSDYPADPLHYDLNFAKEIAAKTGCQWGVSDHTRGSNLAKLARSLGATVFEKHVDFIVSGGRETPDSQVSATAPEFIRYVDDIIKQPILNHKKLKEAHALRYGRNNNGRRGWYRPWPEGAPGVE
jgi:sialic acid synthase SpsE